MIKIREATSNDFQTIQQIAHQTWPDTFGSILSKEQIAYMLDWMYSIPSLEEQITQKSHTFLLAEEEDTTFGYISYQLNYTNQPKVKIHKIYILPSSQGKGVGKALFTQVEAIARSHSQQTLSLNVNRQNPAVQFYERIGFHVTGQENIDIGNGFLMEDYIMEKSLEPALA
ncbi:GNAT family N-acetyltransferase [Xanthocytophaga agilis]|uniref:GNAT family N-acetyltransferase n=1 Tax=Xanthocytophaga agilis TaxID=3048010 RepID=A0AAE3R184_9BACT|nr:GNAT family N-acetyltransferase [Xanthocytophaga agilis]MDJ1501786.1 GNAT family N-acetyltransferase [Xanthocytophaga agilis]